MLPILLYHEIVQGKPIEIHAVSDTQFAAQMEWLYTAGYQAVSLEEWISCQQGKSSMGIKKPIVITFDDGYLDNFTTAMPILEKFGFHATIFLTTGYIGKRGVWRDGPGNDVLLLDWTQLKEMMWKGIYFGSHTVNHPDLTKQEPAIVKRELSDSREYLEQKLGRPVTSFSYPFSCLDATIKQQVKLVGYTHACTYRPGYVGKAGRDALELQRIGILATDSLQDFAAKVRGSWSRKILWYRRLAHKQLKDILHL